MNSLKSNRNHRTRFAGILATVLVLALLAPMVAAAQLEKGSPSLNIAKMARKAENYEVLSDYWLALGNANMLRTRNQRKEATRQALSEAVEAKKEAKERYLARVDLSRALGEYRYNPIIRPRDFLSPAQIARNPNPYWPLVPGTVHTYKGRTEEGIETVVVEVTDESRKILGIKCVVVVDKVYLDGKLIEDTRDWYAQDRSGNVWYFGENSFEVEDGLIVNTEGSWEAGVDGAQPGIVMKAAPAVGDIYRQEYLLGEAEDAAEVLATGLGSVSVPAGTFNNVLKTGEFTPVEPDAYEHKYYAPGVGMIYEFDPGSRESLQLYSITTP